MGDDEGRHSTARLYGRASLGAAVAAAALLLAFAPPWGGGGTAAQGATPSPGPSPQVTAVASPAPKAADGGTVRIVEHGFTELEDASGEHRVSWGLVLENTSRTSAVAVPVTVGILDRGGAQLIGKVSDYARHRSTPYIMPGARYGIGDDTYVKRAGAARLTFRLGAAGWVPPGDPRAPRLTASLVKGKLYRVDKRQLFLLGDPPRAEAHRERRHDLTITFRVESGAPGLLPDGHASAVLRDTKGRIVGGTGPADTVTWTRFPPGWSIQRIRSRGVPPAVDVTRIEIYPEPSYQL
ncbi:hypothetical protein [Actinomadura verrucosospora]|uniref:Uncharacterized protein n=1 Tax=Actinomadura verrucosospora TaxID=46165 RepID=A0A7D4A0F6_ACTVE|nr:hypothetical protein [Actinomadura verrucosospora]QKG25106.1 hypothetical protein ACTIVE_6757 [Actinomadura verrucosospora]